MQQFVVEREVPGVSHLSEQDLACVITRSIEASATLGSQIRWLHSFVTDDKLYCIYQAIDAETILEHARRADIPADRVAAVRKTLTAEPLR